MRAVTNSRFGVVPFENSQRPVFADTYAVAGRFICIEADALLRDVVRNHFAAWHIELVQDDQATPAHVTIEIMRGTPPPPPEHFEPFSVTDQGRCYSEANSYFFADGESVVLAISGTRRVSVWITEDGLSNSVTMARIIFMATVTALRRCGLFDLHAAGLVKPDGDGVLVIGPSGSSKSTLATQLAAAGWKYLSDDTLLLYENSGAIEARALRRAFAVTDETLDAFDSLSLPRTTMEPFDPLKKRFEPADVFPEGFVLSCRPTALFFSRISSDETSDTLSLSRPETLAQLLRMCPWACYDKATARDHLQVLSNLARQARGYQLSVGKDLFGEPEESSRYLMAYA